MYVPSSATPSNGAVYTHSICVFLVDFTTNIDYFQKQHEHICLNKGQGFCFQWCGNLIFCGI